MYCLFDSEFCYFKKLEKPILTEFALLIINQDFSLEYVLYNRINYNLFIYNEEDYIKEYTYSKYNFKNTFRNKKKFTEGISFNDSKLVISNIIKKYNIKKIYLKGVSKFDKLFFNDDNLIFIDLINYNILKYDDYLEEDKLKILNNYKLDLIRFNIILNLNLTDHISLNELLVFSYFFIKSINNLN